MRLVGRTSPCAASCLYICLLFIRLRLRSQPEFATCTACPTLLCWATHAQGPECTLWHPDLLRNCDPGRSVQAAVHGLDRPQSSGGRHGDRRHRWLSRTARHGKCYSQRSHAWWCLSSSQPSCKSLRQQPALICKSGLSNAGAVAKRLDFPGSGEVDGFWNKGISACAVCDGAAPMFRRAQLPVH